VLRACLGIQTPSEVTLLTQPLLMAFWQNLCHKLPTLISVLQTSFNFTSHRASCGHNTPLPLFSPCCSLKYYIHIWYYRKLICKKNRANSWKRSESVIKWFCQQYMQELNYIKMYVWATRRSVANSLAFDSHNSWNLLVVVYCMDMKH